MGKQKTKGKRRTVWLPTLLDQKAEITRNRLGLGLSAFYRFAIIEIIKDMETKEKPKA
jgi:hypothetical protein